MGCGRNGVLKDYKQIWNELSATSDDAAYFVGFLSEEEDIRRNGALTAEYLRGVLQIKPGDRVLEIGCGIARIGRELAPYCGEWHGADISGNMIKHAAQRTEGVPNVHLHELPTSDLSLFEDGYFDSVYSSIVFMHLDKTEMFTYIRDAFRVLVPGGRAYFDTYNILAPEAWEQFMTIVKTFPSGAKPGHVSQFSTPQELNKFMQEAGFEGIIVDWEDNAQLVVTVGVKPGDKASAVRPTSPVREVEVAQPVDETPKEEHTLIPRRELDALVENVEQKNRYIEELERTLAAKDAHIERLERAVRKQESVLSALPVRVAARLSRGALKTK
jgi:SAM-dependent methyltransferase